MEHLPPWLRNVPLPPRPGAADTAAAAPDWLRDLEPAPATPSRPSAAAPPAWLPPADAAPDADADATPDWLRDLQSEVSSTTPPPASAAAAEADDTPDWLRELAAEPAPTPDLSARSDRPAPPGATSWLKSLADETPPAEPPPPTEPPTTTSRVRMPVGATDWLRSIGQETEPSMYEPPAEPPAPEPTPAVDESGVPDWLRDVTPEELASAVAADVPAGQPEPSEADLSAPNWLADLAAEVRPVDDDSISGAVPDWLADLTPADADAPERAPRAEAGTPDWLTADDDAAQEAAAPDWLRDLGGAEEPPAAPLRQPPPAAAEEDVPAWLRDAEAAPTPPPADDVPAWLRDVEEAPAATPSPVADDVPAWLRDAEAAPAAPPPAADDVPAWLRDVEEAPAAPPPADDVPAWLRDAEAAPVAPPPPAADDVPAWLRDVEETPAAPPPAADDVPAWLRDVEETPAAPPPAADDVPAWLRDVEETPAAAPPVDAGEVPTWLRGIAEPTAAPPAEPAAPRQAPPADADVPTWLRDAMQEEAERTPLQSGAAADVPHWLSDDVGGADEPSRPTAAPADLNLPSWLRGVADEPAPAPPPARPARPSAEPARRPSTPDDAEGDDFLRGAELPSWLRVSEPERPTETAEGQALDWLTRLGTSETETEEPEAAPAEAPAVVPQRRIYQRSSEQLEAVDLLSRLVHAPYPTPIAQPEPLPKTRWQQIGVDRILYVVLLLALLIGLFVPVLSTPFQTATPSAPGAAELRELLSGLDSEQVVLVAYEWAAQRSSELRPLEDAVTERLVAQQAKLIIVSTDLQGTLLSFDRIEPLREAGYNAAGGGTDYVLLGYRPGGELALRRLARDLRGELMRDFNGNDATGSLVATNLDGTPRVSSVSDLALIIVMADQPQDVQAWMEQVHRVDRDVPIAFVLPQETQPLVQPYLRLPNVHHIAGLQGALALQAGGATPPTQIAQAVGQQYLAVVIFLVLLIGGATSVAVGRARRSKES